MVKLCLVRDSETHYRIVSWIARCLRGVYEVWTGLTVWLGTAGIFAFGLGWNKIGAGLIGGQFGDAVVQGSCY